MKFLGTDIAPLGMGCWPIGGPFYRGAQPLGYANAEDSESIRTIHAALDAGIQLFDTAAVYGAGHAERLMGEALADHPDAIIITKIGLAFDEQSKQLTGEDLDPTHVRPAIERCLKRLRRDRIDVLLLHVNELTLDVATPLFDAMESARQDGLIRSYGWSTDFPKSVEALADRPGFTAVEHAMNVFLDVPTIQGVIEQHDLAAIIRSPLGMGVLTGKFDSSTKMQADDIRSTDQAWKTFFQDGKINPEYLARVDAIRELLQTGGRTVPQGALCWLWAKSGQNVPVPGARTVAQITDNASALDHGPLPASIMAEIETLITRSPDEDAARAK
ncbi:aldo/keto reductase [Litoreibacter roseus]|uniref:Oxidoreductase n=1 Tax=Litoreibacter roseus TaxID=2601869 RepID=A0A6N6JK10_9RHOB|nr:aldo/keto reductase [Litoreibacter roseus]GFE66646.1 oxidoreductase [Litoreibacter roseus]